jgi:hypothetical protein
MPTLLPQDQNRSPLHLVSGIKRRMHCISSAEEEGGGGAKMRWWWCQKCLFFEMPSALLEIPAQLPGFGSPIPADPQAPRRKGPWWRAGLFACVLRALAGENDAVEPVNG